MTQRCIPEENLVCRVSAQRFALFIILPMEFVDYIRTLDRAIEFNKYTWPVMMNVGSVVPRGTGSYEC